jgi:hypothetical protein
MSKEQTPMKELLSIVEELKSKDQEVDTNGLEDWINSVGLGKEKEHTQAKVLEVLEGFAKHLEKTGVFVMLDVEEYYETEVKPKYK